MPKIIWFQEKSTLYNRIYFITGYFIIGLWCNCNKTRRTKCHPARNKIWRNFTVQVSVSVLHVDASSFNRSCLIFRVGDPVPLAAPALPNVPDAPDVAELVVQVQRRRQEVVPNGHLFGGESVLGLRALYRVEI